MATNVQGRAEIDGNLGKSPNWSQLRIKNGKIVEAIGSDDTIQSYIVENVLKEGGHQLALGNYANPLGVNASVGAFGEVVTLSTGQLDVPLEFIETSSIKQVFVSGKNVDDAFLYLDEGDYTIKNSFTITLSRSYPDGTKIRVSENLITVSEPIVKGSDVVVNAIEDLATVDKLRNGLNAYILSTGQTFIYVIEAGEATGQWTEKDQLGDDVDVTAASHLTLAQAQASDLKVGQYVRLTDRGLSLFLVSPIGTVADGKGSVSIDSGLVLVAQIEGGLTDVRAFGATLDGTTDDTSALIAANARSTNLLIPEGTIRLQNWKPLANTYVEIQGTVQRLDNTTYESTTSSAAIVISNDNITIFRGEFVPQGTDPVWSGGIVVEDGDNINIIKSRFVGDAWAGIFGHETQNAGRQANAVNIEGCLFDGCVHNTYLADIFNLRFTSNVSKNSLRDGLKTYRNCQNHTITDNFIFDNGNGTIGQSQDGIDLFVAGFKTIITGNYIYGNTTKGVDIKFAPTQVGLGVTNRKHQIANNYIYSNGDIGVEVEVTDTTLYGYIDFVTIVHNQIYSNMGRGIKIDGASAPRCNYNDVYDNGGDGIRMDNCIRTAQAIGNLLDNNTGVGLLIQASVAKVIAKNNTAVGSANQTLGISINCAGICKDNDSTGHGTDISCPVIVGLKGDTITSSLEVDTADIAVVATSSGCVSSLRLTANTTAASVNVTVQSRDVNNGTNDRILFNGTVSFTAYVPAELNLSTGVADRLVQEGQSIIVSYSGFTPTSITALTNVIN